MEENSFKRSATQITTVWRGVVCDAAAGEMDAPAAAPAVTPVLLSLVVVGGDVYGWQLLQQPCEYCKNKYAAKMHLGLLWVCYTLVTTVVQKSISELTAGLSAKKRKFTQAHRDWTTEDWKHVSWSDESRLLQH